MSKPNMNRTYHIPFAPPTQPFTYRETHPTKDLKRVAGPWSSYLAKKVGKNGWMYKWNMHVFVEALMATVCRCVACKWRIVKWYVSYIICKIKGQVVCQLRIFLKSFNVPCGWVHTTAVQKGPVPRATIGEVVSVIQVTQRSWLRRALTTHIGLVVINYMHIITEQNR